MEIIRSAAYCSDAAQRRKRLISKVKLWWVSWALSRELFQSRCKLHGSWIKVFCRWITKTKQWIIDEESQRIHELVSIKTLICLLVEVEAIDMRFYEFFWLAFNCIATVSNRSLIQGCIKWILLSIICCSVVTSFNGFFIEFPTRSGNGSIVFHIYFSLELLCSKRDYRKHEDTKNCR